MGDESRDRLERHYEALLKSYGDVMIAQAATDRTIEERTRAGNERAERLQAAVTKLDDEKADVTTVDDVVTELRYIRRLLVGLLVSICLACVGFGFAALQIAGSH